MRTIGIAAVVWFSFWLLYGLVARISNWCERRQGKLETDWTIQAEPFGCLALLAVFVLLVALVKLVGQLVEVL